MRTVYKTIKGMVILFLLLLLSCTVPGVTTDEETTDSTEESSDEDSSELADWTDATHGKLSTDEIITNMDRVFDTSEVQKIRIVIDPDNWQAMEDELSDLEQELGNSTDFSSVDNPSFVPCDLYYNGIQWYYVGIRFKGNSSLYNANCDKLPFKLDFDEFEDDYPAIKNQRFYGFKQLNLKNNYDDESEMHEVVAGDLFRNYGLVSAHCSFYELYLNVDGSDDESGDIYYGLYTLVEEVDDTVIETQYYGNDSGNLYKPEDDGATFAADTYDEDEYGLQTDVDESYSDISALYSVLNCMGDYDGYTVGSESWQTALESILDVDTFLDWLAANTVMQNWDTYGVMDHNFFLYNNPLTGKFEWIPWDNNEALVSNNRCLSFDELERLGSSWPLIGYILGVDGYLNQFKTAVSEFAAFFYDEIYNDDGTTVYDDYETMIKDYVTGEGSNYTFTSEREFTEAVNELIDHTGDRCDAAEAYCQ